MIYDYYTVNVPVEAYEDRPDMLAYAVINQAREQARLYCVPCDWTILAQDGDNFKVRRRRRRQ